MSATTSSLAFEVLEGEEEGLEVMKRLAFGPAFPFLRKAAVEEVFHEKQTTIEEVVCISGKMTVSF